ncbi:MAG: sulfatase-like hydrolase/transferase [Planctomycetota bacterium]|jgi:arylsulfatase A-like enzyme
MARKISRRRALGLASGAAVTAAAGAALSRFVGGPKKPSRIVLIVSDAMRADRLGALRAGRSITPNLDALAARGLVFENCYAPSTWTKTSMASILTGTYPPYNGVLTPDDTIPKNCDTIADMLKRQGYDTYGVQTNPWLAPEEPTLDTHGKQVRWYGFHKGFDSYRYLEPDTLDRSVEQPAYANAVALNGTAEEAIARPFGPLFLYLHYMETHQPWLDRVPREFSGKFCSKREGRSVGAVFHDDQKLIKRIFSVPFEEVSDDEKVRLDEIYDEAVAYVDMMIGRIITSLRERPEASETLIIFTSDHGDELFDHRGLGHAHTVYEELTRVPLIICGPGIRPGRVRERLSNVNLYETLKALVCPEDEGRESVGAPLIAASGRAAVHDEVIFSQLCPPIAGAARVTMTKVIKRDLTAGIVRENAEGEVVGVERYDLGADPAEKRPLSAGAADSFVEEAARFGRDYSALARKHGVAHTKTGARWQRLYAAGEEEPSGPQLTEEEKRLREQLKALGYIGQ